MAMFRFIVFFTMCLLYITQELISNEIVNILFTIICITAFIIAFLGLDQKNQLFISLLFFTGVSIHFLYGQRWLYLFDGITQNLALLSIILLAPLISLPLKGEGVIDTITLKLNDLKNDNRKTFYGVSLFMMMLAPILNMGAIRIVHGFVGDLKIPSKLLSNAYYGGFTQAIIWSPFFASVGIVLSIAEFSYLTYMPIGLCFAVTQFTVAFFMLRPKENIMVSQPQTIEAKIKMRNKDFGLLISFVMLLIMFLILMEATTKLPMLLLVCISCLIIPSLWMLLRDKCKWMKDELRIYKDQLTQSSNLEISLFLSAGLFGKALLHTPIATGLRNVILWSSKGSILLVFLFVVSFITLMAFLGIHQIISLAIILPLLLLPEINVSTFAAAFMCIFSWMISASISPLNALNIIISQCVKVNGIRVGLTWNGKYFLTITLLAFAYVLILNQI